MAGEGRAAAPNPNYEGGGAGGKFRRRPFRKPHSTPYDRPPPPPDVTAARRSDGWLSKIANPASRLLARGATRFFPSLFSKTKTLTDQQMEQEANEELQKDGCLIEISEAGEQRDHHEDDGLKSGPDNDALCGDKWSNSYGSSELAEIEQLLKQKTFSSNEVNLLTEILRSRTTDLPDYGREGKTSPDVIPLGEAAEEPLQRGNLRKSVERNQPAQLDSEVMGRTPAPLVQSTIYDEVGTSPIDIAKAFMGSRTSALNTTSQSVFLKNERMPPSSDGLVSSSAIPSTPLRSTMCWPGAMVQEVPGYLTPQTQGRIGLHNLPRSPYHRSVYSRSISKGFGERPFNLPSSRPKQQHTPIFGASQVKKSNVSDGGSTSVGSINRKRQKSMEIHTSKGVTSHSASPGLLPSSSGAFEGFISTIPENLNTKASKSSTTMLHPTENKAPGYSSTVHPHSSEMARRILEHLDRAVPSPKEKVHELKIAVSGQKPLPEVSTGMLNGQHSQPVMSPGSFSSGHLLFQNGDMGKGAPHIVDEYTKADKVGSLRNTGFLASKSLSDRYEISADTTHKKHGDSSSYNQSDEKGIPKVVCSAAFSDVFQIPKPQSLSSGNKPALTSISITKPNGRCAFPPDNGSGFTFPVSSASVSVSEPPTPTMISPFGSKITLPKEGTAAPSFTFGSSNVSKGPVLSFPSTSSSSVVDTSIPKFNFGSEKKASVSFR
ncbi:hypothetical protein AAC387_Pa03g3475 [Persea americana]